MHIIHTQERAMFKAKLTAILPYAYKYMKNNYNYGNK